MKRIFLLLMVCMMARAEFADDPLQEYLRSQLRYWGIAEKVTSADLEQLVQMKRNADKPGLTQEARTEAYTQLFHFVQKLRGYPEGRVPGSIAAAYWSPGISEIQNCGATATLGRLGAVRKSGKGTIPLILIHDIGVDSSVFDDFMKRNQTQFRFYAVTLPGFGGTNPPARSEKLDFGQLKWWNNATTALVHLIQSEKIDRPFLLGHQAGSYLAMRVALEHPDLVRGAIVLNGLLSASFPGMPANATIPERVKYVNSLTPVELFPVPSPETFFHVMMQSGTWFCKSKERQEVIARLMSKEKSCVWWNYFAELATTDLSAQIKSLKVPMLVLPSVYDQGSAGYEQTKVTIEQWAPLEHAKSGLPITIVRMEDSRSYATEDQPAKLDENILQWTSLVAGKSGRPETGAL